MGVQLKEQPISFVRRQNHELSKLLRNLTKESEAAVQVLVALLESKDEKTRMNAASKLLDMQKDISEAINKDEITRLLAELKLNGGGVRNLIPEDDTPLVDFTTVQEV